ncbi:hypothetical protein Tco_0690979 [Tanacetum coccineum]
MSSFNQRGCFGCGGPLDGLLCRRCTCEWCGNNLRNGFCSFCASRAGNSFVYDPNPNSFNDPLNVFNHPLRPQTYLCELCGNDSHYGFDCPPRNFYEPNLCYNSNSSGFDQPPQYSIDHQPQSIQEDFNQQRMNDVHNEWINNDMIESRNELLKTMQSLGEMLRDTIPLNEIISQLPPSIAITPILPTMEPEDSLIMEDENLSTIPEKEPDEFINDDESLPEEDVPEENFKIYSKPLFEFDEEYISSDINPLYNKVLEDIENKNSYVSNLDELALLVTPLSDANEDECFDPEGDIDKIDAFLDIDVSTNIEDDYHDSEGDVIYLKCFLTNDTTHNLPPEVFLDHDQRG